MSNRPDMPRADTLPTPHPPGDFPETPAPGAFNQDEGEGILDQAGRDHDGRNRALGGGLLAGALGMVVAGPLGAIVGATLGTAAGLEEQGLQAKFEPHEQAQATTTKDAVPDLSDSPAQRMLGEGGSEALSGLLGGAAGAHLADREVEEPTTDKISPAELSGLPVNDETSLDMSPAGLETPAEKKKDGLSQNQKLALGAGAGLGAGALAGTALSRNNDDVSEPATFSKFDSPYTPGLESSTTAQPGPPMSTAPTVVGTSSEPSLQPPIFSESQATASATDHVMHNPEYTPGPEAAGLPATAESDLTPTPAEEDSRLKQAAPYAAAGAAGLAGVGAATALARDNDHDHAAAVQSEIHEGPTSRSPEVVEANPATTAPTASTATPAAAAGAAAASTLPAEDNILDREAAQPRDLSEISSEEESQKHSGREKAAAAALGAIGGATGVEALHKAGASEEEAQAPPGQDPTAALMAQLGGKDPAPAMTSRFHEGLDNTTPSSAVPPRLTSRFSDATVDTISSDRTIDAPLDLDDQRARAPVPLFRDGSYLADEDKDSPRHNRKIAPEALAATAALGAVPGLAHADPNSTVFQDFAHLSEQPGAAPVEHFEADPREVAQAQEAEREQEHPHGVAAGTMAGVGAGAAAGGLAAAYMAEHRGDSSSGALPQSPKHLNLRHQLGEGDYSPSTPSSTRAIKGSPTPSGAATPASFAQQGAYTPPMDQDQEGYMAAAATPYAAQSDYYAGHRDHQQTFSPQQQQEDRPIDEPSRSYQPSQYQQSQHGDNVKEVEHTPHMGIATVKDSQGRSKLHKHDHEHTIDPEQGLSPEQIRQQEHLAALNPVERSPHMKIATRKDSIGHKKLHKKSLGDPTQQHGSSSPVQGDYYEGGSGSPARRSSIGSGSNSPRATQGEGIWNGAVANVVNDETAHRGGQRPALVTIDSEDRRDHPSDRQLGVADGHSHNQSTSFAHSPDSPSGSNKLRRKSLSNSNQGNPNPRFGPDGFPRRDQDGNEVQKQGFVSKLFGHKKSPSKGSSSPRTSMEGRRASIDEQGRTSLDGGARQ